jgi:hypothetical protein
MRWPPAWARRNDGKLRRRVHHYQAYASKRRPHLKMVGNRLGFFIVTLGV